MIDTLEYGNFLAFLEFQYLYSATRFWSWQPLHIDHLLFVFNLKYTLLPYIKSCYEHSQPCSSE